MAYEVVNGTLIPIKEKGQIKKIPLDSIYYRNLTEDYALVINSFKNKVLIVDESCIRNNMLEISEEMEELLATPTRYPDGFSVDNLYDNQKILNASNNIYISFAITYSCNLRCSYCFQQQYKSLVRKPITLEELEETLAQISILISDNPKLNISFGLFGGEPLLPQNEPIIDRIFQYCVEHKIKIDITTNGIFLPFFAKKLIIHRGIISGIAITVNTLPENYEEAVKITKVANNTKKLLKITQVLLDFGLNIDVGTNFDRTNIDNLINLFNYFKEHGYFSKSNFFWNIGRVDDRFFDSGYDDFIVSEVDILLELMKIRDNIPDNLHAGFIQTCQNLTDKLGLSFNQRQNKGIYNYCWNVSPYDRVFYIDNELNMFRCTVTVGRPEYILGNLKTVDLLNYQHETRTFLDNSNCKSCVIGGFCSGGCALSADIDFQKQCSWELQEFEKFVDLILIPEIVSLLGELNVKSV